MTWLDGFSDLRSARERAETAFYAPIGMMSPLWIAFGAAASAGAAFWLLSRWAKPVNVEASTAVWGEVLVADVVAPAPTNDVPAAAAPSVLAESVMGCIVIDDLTKLAGIGPKIANALAERGVKSFAQLAAWTEEDLAAFDAALDLRGRAIRADFIAQARGAASGKP